VPKCTSLNENKYALIIHLNTLIIKTGNFQGKNLEFGFFETMIFGSGTLKLGKLDF
jgi:hypothetical protein